LDERIKNLGREVLNELADNVVETTVSESALLGRNPERVARLATATVIIGHNGNTGGTQPWWIDMPRKQMYIVHAVWKTHSDVEPGDILRFARNRSNLDPVDTGLIFAINYVGCESVWEYVNA
jgi:hypothetical protein